MEGSGTLEKIRNSLELSFSWQKNFEWVLESPRIEKLVEYSRIYGFGLYLAYEDIVVS